MEDIRIVGSELPITIHIDPISTSDGNTNPLEETDFEAEFFIEGGESLIIPRSEMTQIDADTFVAYIDTTNIGAKAVFPSKLYCAVRMNIANDDFTDTNGNKQLGQKVIVKFDTGVKLQLLNPSKALEE